MLIQFETNGLDDSIALEAIDMPCVPRKGEVVAFRGPDYGGERRFNTEGVTVFEVVEVSYDMDVADGTTDVAITVHLKLHEQDEQASIFRKRCSCKEEHREVSKSDPGYCDSCRGIAWWKK